MAEQFRILEYPLVIIFIIIGGVFLVACSDLISIFLAIELQSYGLYILCSIYRNSEKATSAGLTYFLLGGLSSCFILLASGLLYGGSGDTSFDGIYIINNISNASLSVSDTAETTFVSWYEPYYINFSLVFMSIGFLFKVTAAPFHFWSPDVYDAIPTIVTTFVAIFAKISIFILLLELVHYTSNFYTTPVEAKQTSTLFNYSWTYTLLLSSLLSFIIGSVLGLTQFRIKRLYAYSTISHVGFILLALTINSVESIQSFIFYLMQYSLSNLNAFIILIAIGYSLYLYVEKSAIGKGESSTANLTLTISEKKNSPLQLISQMKGYFNVNPTLAISLAITIFSFVGIPPLIGFFAKQMVLSAALDSGYLFMVFIAILTSVVSAYYYLALIKQIFFYESEYIINPQIQNVILRGTIVNSVNNKNLNLLKIGHKNIVLSSSLTTTISVLTLTILFFILNPEQWSSLANILALILFSY